MTYSTSYDLLEIERVSTLYYCGLLIILAISSGVIFV